MKKILALFATMVISMSVLPSAASPAQAVEKAKPSSSAALPHWSPWILCNTSGHDYHVRVYVIPIGNKWWPDTLEVARAASNKTPPPYNYIEMDYSDASDAPGKHSGAFNVSRRTTGTVLGLYPFEWKGSRRPQVSFTLGDKNNVYRCTTQRVAVG